MITGVIDFGSAALGDPAADLASVPALGDRFLDRFYLAYPDLATASVRDRMFSLPKSPWRSTGLQPK